MWYESHVIPLANLLKQKKYKKGYYVNSERSSQYLRTLYFNFSNTRTYLWNIRDLDNPILENTYDSTEPAIDHNQYVLGDYTYQSNYEAGLRILRIDQANYDLNEVAYFDVHPEWTTPSFTGTWSNFPYYTRGIISY